MEIGKNWRTSNDGLPRVDDPERALCRATRCVTGELAEYVLLPGDPSRAALIAERWLTDGRLVMANREFHSYTGTYKNVGISVVSTGLGSPGAAMVVQDLPKLGVKAAIRVGTAGSTNMKVRPGDLVIGTSAVRDEGVSHLFMPANFPAVADFELTAALHRIGGDTDATVHTGIVHTSDAFYSPTLSEDHQRYQEANVLAFDMEAAAVLVLAGLNRIPAGCILCIDGYVTNVADGNTVPDAKARDIGITRAITIALDTMVEYSTLSA